MRGILSLERNMSILYQLKKYQPTNPPKPIIQVGESNQIDGRDWLRDLATRIVKMSYAGANILGIDIEKEISHAVGLLADMSPERWTGILYPIEVLATYHTFYVHGEYIAGEPVTDWFLFNFLMQTDLKEFKTTFENAIDAHTKKLVMARVLLATYGGGQRQEDRLPYEPFRQVAATYLGVQPSAKSAADALEHLNLYASLEQMILGRMGYLVIWHTNQRAKQPSTESLLLSYTPLLSGS
jgi:hypothetical protein